MNNFYYKVRTYGLFRITEYAFIEIAGLIRRLFWGSYSQKGEDLFLSRMFPKHYEGFYVDVGANDPIRFNNTYKFYKRGWKGMNIEPDANNYKKLKEVASVSIGEFVHKNKQNPNGVYPVYNGGTSNTGFYDEFNRTANKIIISARGANAGFVNRVFVDFWAGNSCYTISVKEKYLDWNFTYYVLKNSENKLINEQQKGGIPAVSKKQVEEFYSWLWKKITLE